MRAKGFARLAVAMLTLGTATQATAKIVAPDHSPVIETRPDPWVWRRLRQATPVVILNGPASRQQPTQRQSQPGSPAVLDGIGQGMR